MRNTHHAFRYRNLHGWGLALGLVCGLPLTAHAGYAQASVPSGLTRSGADWVANAANGGRWASGTFAGEATINVGRQVTMPAVARFAANASTMAARSAFLNPYALAATGVAYFATQCISYTGGQWLLTCGPEVDAQNSTVYLSTGYYMTFGSTGQKCYSATACSALDCQVREGYSNQLQHCVSPGTPISLAGGNFGFTAHYVYGNYTYGSAQVSSTCPSGWYVTPAGCVQQSPNQPIILTPQQFETKVAPLISPEVIPDWFPEYRPIPVESPKLNPDEQGNPQPLTVPLGDPVPVPNTNPQQYRQPLARIVPSPTPDQPFRVDVQPIDQIGTSPTGVTQPTTNPNPDGSAQPQESKSDLCRDNPDIAACRKDEYDTPEGEIPRDTIDVTYTPENFLGGGGSCPAPTDIHFMGHTARVFETSQACGWVTAYMRPILLVLCAWLALSIVSGGMRQE